MSSSWGQTASYPMSPDPTLDETQWLQQLPRHPIFSTDAKHTAPPKSDDVAVQPRSMIVRGTDLIAVVDNQLRIASLVDAKASASGYPLSASPSSSATAPSPMSSLGYKVLASSEGALPFTVRHLCVNTTGKLLACVGDSQVSVVVLPRTGYSKHIDLTISCRSVAVGPYYHSLHAESSIVKVSWHPWGDGGSSLLVLTDDGVLREYDVAKDAEEPQQTASFLPVQADAGRKSRSSTPSFAARSSSTQVHASPLTAQDDDAVTAVSFSLCVTSAPTSGVSMFDQGSKEAWATAASRARSPTDWSPLTVYGLMKNGDIWAICPFLPKNATVPSIFLHSLAKLTSLKANTESQDDMQLRYLNALLRQAPSATGPRHERTTSSVTPGPDSFARSRSGSAMDLDQLVDSSTVDQPGSDQVLDRPLRLHPPSWSYSQALSQGSSAKKAPRPQGPFLFKPAPIELSDERESSACDLIWMWLSRDSDQSTSGSVSGVGALAVVGHDGRVDVGLVLEAVEASWTARQQPTRAASARRSKSTKPLKTNKYALSDTDDEAEELFDNMTLNGRDSDEVADLPYLLMYETINLGLLDTAQESGLGSQSKASDFLLKCAESNRPCFVRDPLYQDTIYVYHALGAQCLGFAKWADKLLAALNLPSDQEGAKSNNTREQALVKLLHQGENTEVVWVVNTAIDTLNKPSTNPVTAISVMSDVYLSYAFLAITQDQQLVAVELSLRVDMDASAAKDAKTERQVSSSVGGDKKQLYISLLGDGPAFQPPALFAQTSTVQGLSSRARRTVAASSGQLEVTPETLRALGKAVEAYRFEIRDVVSAGNAVQARLDLQVREMNRQLEKLNSIRLRCDSLLGAKDGQGSLQARMQRISQNQASLLARTDRALQKLMDHHQPDLSMYERQWFDELARIAADVGLQSTSDSPTADFVIDPRNKKSLASKAEDLSHQLSLLRPQMQTVRASTPASPAQSGLLGSEQLKRVEALLSTEAAMLAESRAKIQELNRKIAHLQPSATPTAADRTPTRSGIPTSSTAVNFGDYENTSFSSSSHILPRRM